MSAIITTSKVRREAVSASLASQQLIPIYRPSTYSMSDITGRIVAAAASGEKIYLGPGNYDLNINLPNGGSPGFGIVGAGRNRTFLISGAPNTPVFACQGLWYSTFEGLSFSHQQLGAGTMPAVDIDGKTGDNARGVQGNTWTDCAFSARGAYDGLRGHTAFWMCRVAYSAGQGSENCFNNCHFYASTFACCAITGYNALNNQFFGGNVQDYTKHGLYFQAGSFHVYNMGFQSTTGITQIDNDGWDIWANGGGVGDSVTVTGCRTESLRFMLGNGAQPPLITNCLQYPAVLYWFPNYTYTAGTAFMHPDSNGIVRLYRAVNTFTTGPTFAVTGDMQLVTFNVIESIRGKEINNNWYTGNVSIQSEPDNLGRGTDVDYEMKPTERWVAGHANANDVVVALPDPGGLPEGHEVMVLRTDHNPAYRVRVYSNYFDNNPTNVFYDDLDTTTRRTGRYKAIGGHYVARRWYRYDAVNNLVDTAANLAATTQKDGTLVIASDTNDIRRGNGSTVGGILVQGGTRRFTGSAEAIVVNGGPAPSPAFSIPIAAGATYEISGVIGFNGDTDLLSNFIARGIASGTTLFQDATFATRVGVLLCDYAWTHDAAGREVADRTVWATVTGSGPLDLVAESLNRAQGRCRFSFRITVATSASGNYDFRFYTRIAKVGTPTIMGSWDITATRIG